MWEKIKRILCLEALGEIVAHMLGAFYALAAYKILIIVAELMFGGAKIKTYVEMLDAFVVLGVLFFLAIEILGYFYFRVYKRWKRGFKVLVMAS
jgi:hypothetical protein